MGWETDLFTNISFNRDTFNSIDTVNSRLDEVDHLIKIYEEDLKTTALITEPKKFCDEDQDPLWFITNKVRVALEELEILYIDRYKLSLLADAWDECHDKDGYAIPRPDNIKLNTSFLDGDFIKHSKDD